MRDVAQVHSRHVGLVTASIEGNPPLHALTIQVVNPNDRRPTSTILTNDGYAPHRVEGEGDQIYWMTPAGWADYQGRGGHIVAESYLSPNIRNAR